MSAYRPESRASRMRSQSSCFGTASARATSTFAMRKTVERLWTPSPGGSNGAPASAQTSASPLASIDDGRPRSRRTPPFVATSTPATRPSSTDTAKANACRSVRTPASAVSSSQTRLSVSGSYVIPVPAPYVFGRSNAIPRSVRRETTSSGIPATTFSGRCPGV